MRVKSLSVTALFLFFPAILSATASHVEDKTGQQQLKTLKDVHIHNNIFDNYSTGGISPSEEEKDTKNEN